jgi:protein-tyrosine phosphatase
MEQAEYDKIDFHCHVIPKMDDGAKNTDESVTMLSMLKEDGVETVYATPHFYPQYETVKSFLLRRTSALKNLKKAMTEAVEPSKLAETFPEIKIGAEVYFVPSKITAGMKELPELCIEGTDFLLLELPYEKYNKTLINAVSSFIAGCKHTVVLAHLERYLDMMTAKQMDEILNNNLLAQVNCNSVIEGSSNEIKFIKKLSADKIMCFLGSDAHGAIRRPPEYAKALKIIRKKIPGFFTL